MEPSRVPYPIIWHGIALNLSLSLTHCINYSDPDCGILKDLSHMNGTRTLIVLPYCRVTLITFGNDKITDHDY